MKLTHDERLYLNALSKNIYGATSYWRNKIANGVLRPKSNVRGASDMRYFFSYEEIKAYMLEVKETREKLLAEMKAEQQNAASNKEQPL